MNGRFSGDEGKNALVDVLRRQRMVSGNTDLAERIASIGELVDVPEGTAIIEQGGDDNEVYLIVAGAFHIVVNGKTIARRTANDHVGEMAAILPVQRRAASVVAQEASTAVKLSNSQIVELGERHPQIWRCFAKELAHRVEQRNRAVATANENVRLFIMAPAAAAEIARAIHDAFENEPFQAVIWTEGSFQGSSYAIETLESALDQSDIAIAVLGPQNADPGNIGPAHESRDNVIFEVGFFMGRLGRHRTFLIEPRNEETKLPPELAGINTIAYKFVPGQDIREILAPACNELRQAIDDLGPNR